LKYIYDLLLLYSQANKIIQIIMASTTEQIMTLVNDLDASQRSTLVKSIWALNKSEKPVLSDEQKAENKRAAIAKSVATRAEKRAQAIADGTITPKTDKPPLSDEEKAERKIAANEKRKATWALKRAQNTSNSSPKSPPRPRGRPKKSSQNPIVISSDDEGSHNSVNDNEEVSTYDVSIYDSSMSHQHSSDEPVVADEPEPEPVVADEPEPEPVVADEPEPEPVVADEPEPVVADEPEPEPVVADEPEPEPVVVDEPKPKTKRGRPKKNITN
jgi:hypothetical protein